MIVIPHNKTSIPRTSSRITEQVQKSTKVPIVPLQHHPPVYVAEVSFVITIVFETKAISTRPPDLSVPYHTVPHRRRRRRRLISSLTLTEFHTRRECCIEFRDKVFHNRNSAPNYVYMYKVGYLYVFHPGQSYTASSPSIP